MEEKKVRIVRGIVTLVVTGIASLFLINAGDYALASDWIELIDASYHHDAQPCACRACQYHWITGEPGETNGYVITGVVRSNVPIPTRRHAYIRRIDNWGRMIWEYLLGAADASSYMWIRDIHECPDGGFFVVADFGIHESHNFEMAALKLNRDGTVQWGKYFHGQFPRAWAGIETTTGDYILVGCWIDTGALVTKLDADGNHLWTKDYPLFKFMGVEETDDGNYMLVAQGSSVPAKKISMVKIDPNGNVLDCKAYGTGSFDYSLRMARDDNGDFLVGGWTHYDEIHGTGSNRDAYILKVSGEDGSVLWSKMWGLDIIQEEGMGRRWRNDWVWGVDQIMDGNYVLAVRSGSFYNDPDAQDLYMWDIVHLKLDKDTGNKIVGTRFVYDNDPIPYPFDWQENLFFLDAAFDGGSITMAATMSDAWDPPPDDLSELLVLKLNENCSCEDQQFVDLYSPDDGELIPVEDVETTMENYTLNSADYNWEEIGDYGEVFALNPASTVLTLCATDSDGDGVKDPDDNCPATYNPNQEDTDGDGYGNACDCDIAPAPGDGRVNFLDKVIFMRAFGSHEGDPEFNPDADFTGPGSVCDGRVNSLDKITFKHRWNQPPGD